MTITQVSNCNTSLPMNYQMDSQKYVSLSYVAVIQAVRSMLQRDKKNKAQAVSKYYKKKLTKPETKL